MPQPFQHRVNRVTLYGSSFGGQEIWTTGFYLGNEGSDVGNPSEATAAAIKTAWAAFCGATDVVMGYLWKTEGVKIAPLRMDGTTDVDFVVNSPYTTAVAGNSGQIGYPPQISLTATLLAGNGRGLAGKGRMYLPGISAGLDATGHLGGTQNQNIANRLKTFFDAVEASIDVPGQLINASHGRAPFTGSTATNRAVTHVRVGNVYDTQRRRRNSLVESYATAELAA